MVSLGGTDFASRVADSDCIAYMVVVVHTEADTSFDTNWVGNALYDMMLVLV